MRKLLLLSLALMLTLAQQVLAQNKTVSGKVTDKETGEGLPGVNVMVKGTTIGASTNIDGVFNLSVPAGSNTLVFSYLGYAQQEREVGNASTVNVSLAVDDRQLSEVVVTGYGTQNRHNFTGAAATVTGESIQDRPVQSFAQALSGKAAGVNIIQPNGVLNNPPVIRIRGVNSISLSSAPLIVVDGIPISSGEAGNSASNNLLADINPADIESIDILKDAASTSIYGSRAANGVIIITTKKGKAGRTRVTYDGWVGINNVTRLPDMLNAQQYMDYKNEAVRNALSVNPALVPAAQRDANGVSFFPSYNEDGSLVETNWADEIYRTAVSHNHALTVSGGTENTSYYFSIGVSDQEGFIKANDFDRKSARLNLNHKVTDWFSMRGNITYSNSINAAANTGSLPGQAFNSGGLGRLAMVLPPNVAARNPDGSYNITTSNAVGPGANLASITYWNPLPIIELNQNTSENNRVIANLGADFNLFKGLTFKTTYSLDRANTENVAFNNPVHGDGWSAGGTATNSNANRINWNWVNTLQYQKTFGANHHVSLLVGTDMQQIEFTSWNATRQGLSDTGFDVFQAGYGINSAGGGIGLRAYESYLTSLTYNYADKYFLTGNFRRDGNSALAPTKRWGNFGGASVGWLLSEEDFFRNSPLARPVSNLKLKASWGHVGNGNLNSDFGSFSTFGTGLYGEEATLAYNQAGNLLLSWETSNQTNIGLDLGLLNNKITLEANYYYNDVDGLILSAPQALSKGIPGNSILTNVGSMYNKGYELAVSATLVDKSKFLWTTSLNFTKNKNEVTSLAGDNAPISGSTSSLETANLTTVGQSVGSIYVVRTGGVNPANGRRIFINAAGEEVQYLHGGGADAWTYLDGTKASPVTYADATLLRNALPTWYGGFTNSFTYGNFDLSLLLTYSGGNYIYNGTKAGLRDQRFWNNHTDVLARWTAEGQETDIPRPIYGDNVSNGSSIPLDVNLEKGDFVRLQNAVLGYRLPQSVFGKSGISSLRLYAQIDNAFLVTNYTGADPEISSNGSSNTAPGVERNTVPQGRVYTFGVNLGF